MSPKENLITRLNTNVSVLRFKKKFLLIVFVAIVQSGWFVVRHEAEGGIVNLLHCGERLGLYKSLKKLTWELNLRAFIPQRHVGRHHVVRKF